MKVRKKIKSFYEWYINFIRNHPLLSVFSAFIKGMIIGGLIVFLWPDTIVAEESPTEWQKITGTG